MSHWHRMEIRLWDRTDAWGDDVGVFLRPPQLSYERIREEIQERLDWVFKHGSSRSDRDFAHAWRAGTENPPDTVIDYDTNKILTIFACDNECPREAQIVADDWVGSMGRKAPRITRRHLLEHPDRRWPADFKRLFDDPEPAPYRRRSRGKSRYQLAIDERAAEREAARWRAVQQRSDAWHAARESAGDNGCESLGSNDRGGGRSVRMYHWHRMEIRPHDSAAWFGYDTEVKLCPPRWRYEDLRAEVQGDLDESLRHGDANRHERELARTWRSGTENPPDTMFLGPRILVLFGCDNECPREAQVVLDELCDSMGRKAPRVTRLHVYNSPRDPWPKDFLGLFDEPEPLPHRHRDVRASARIRAAKQRAAAKEAERWRAVQKRSDEWHATRQRDGQTGPESL